jgi:hypothetical protein
VPKPPGDADCAISFNLMIHNPRLYSQADVSQHRSTAKSSALFGLVRTQHDLLIAMQAAFQGFT